ncbi:MAG: universal stress protein [Haloarculaceae archaeon]
MTALLDRVVIPVANEADADRTCRALVSHDPGQVIAVYVVEKAGSAPDKASVEQREAVAEAAFAVVRETFPDADSEVRYATSVPTAVFEAAADRDATAIAFVPRAGGRWIRLLTGDVALSLVTETDRPVIALPDPDAGS